MTIAYQVETYDEVFPVIQDLLMKHWQEIALDKDKIPLAPDWDVYEQMAKDGRLHVVTARDDGKLIGYWVSFIRPHLHYRTSLTAYEDIYYIDPEYRKGMVGVRLIKEAEATLKAKGVERLYASTKVSLDMSPLFERLGWRKTEIVFTKFIGD